jgi:D-threo-aldose 1-dehydrogenase
MCSVIDLDPFQKVQLGATDVSVTRFGFGGAPLGERFLPVDNEAADAIVNAAYDAGITYFDTAPQYGQGKSEARLGRVLHRKPRDSYVLSTKVGHLFTRPADPAAFALEVKGGGYKFVAHSDYTRDGVMRSYEDSLLRLGLNRVDMLAIHDLDTSHHGSREVVDRHFEELTRGGGWKALEELKRTGEIRAIGCGVNQLGTIPEFLDRGDVDFFLVAMPYTLIDQGALDVEFPLCAARGVSVVIGAVFASGILATGAKETASYAYGTAPPKVIEKVRRIENVCHAHGVSLQSAALQFPLFHPVVAAIIPGAYRPENISDNLASFRATIPTAFWSELVAEGLIRPDSPLPKS